MKKVNILCAGLAAAVAASALGAFGAGEGASQKWTKMYVEDSISNALAYVECYVSNAIANSVASLVANAKTTTSNGVTTVSVGEGKNRMWFSYEEASVDALVATNATDAASEFGITNGFLFVWDGDGTYINGNGETIITYTNRNCLTWHEIDSVVTNGFETFEGNFAVLRTMLQPSIALAVTNGLRVAEAKMSIFDFLGSLIVGSVYAEEPGNLPQSAKDWYTPRNFQKENVYGTISTFNNETGEYETQRIEYNQLDADKIMELFGITSAEGRLAAEAMQIALKADENAQLADAEVKQIAENLAALDWSTLDAEVKDTSSGATSQGTITKVVEKKIYLQAPGLLGGCGDDCKNSIKSIATFLGDSITVAESGSTGSCVTVTASGTLFESVLNKLPICYYGSAFEVGSSAPKQIFEDAELTIPMFGAAEDWAGDGLEADASPVAKKKLNVKVTNPGDFNAKSLAQILDGDTTKQNADGVAYADVSGVAAVDGEGHLRKINIGAISLAVDGTTIVREKEDADKEDSPLVLKAKIANMVDGSTITTEGEGGAAKAKVKVDALCDDDTIGVNASNKLCVKKSGIKIIGTDGNSNWPKDDTDAPAQTITFASASDSNVKVTVTGDKTSATVTIGVYYK